MGFYKYATLQLKKWLPESNFHTYLVQSDKHTYLPEDVAWATPGHAEGGDSIKPVMIKWFQRLVNPESGENAMKTVCSGPEKVILESTDVDSDDIDYCSKKLAGVASKSI